MASLILGALPIPLSIPRSEPSHFVFTIRNPSHFSPLFHCFALNFPCYYFLSPFRGDKKTERGKRFNHSFGNARPRNKNKGSGPPRVPVPAAPPKKDKFEDDSVVKVEIDESLS